MSGSTLKPPPPLSEAERESLLESAWAEARQESKDLKHSAIALARHALTQSKVHWRVLTRSSEWRVRKFEEIDARLAALEQGGNLADCYAGTHDSDSAYQRGQLVTHGGSLWLVLRDVQGEKPGPSTAYRLILKGGKL